MQRYAIIDSDSLTYAIPFSCEDRKLKKTTKTLKQMTARIDANIRRILNKLDAAEYQLFLTGNDHLRYAVDPRYKANRANSPKPIYYKDAREHLVSSHHATVSEGTEADDDVCIEYNRCFTEEGYTDYEPVIVHIDKDINQLPGLHYNPTKKILYTVTEEEGLTNLYTQSLEGDTVDNIKGIKGMGPKRTRAYLEEVEGCELGLYTKCLEKYQETYGADVGLEKLHKNMQLLYLVRFEGDTWNVPSR